jgi:glycosyl transferase family 25
MNFTTFVINLDHAKERYRTVSENLNKLKIPFTRIPAVYGKNLTEPIRHYSKLSYMIRTGKSQNNAEIGCYFSHIKTLKYFLETQFDYALVLEDDAQVNEHLPTILDDCIRCKSKWDLIRLSSSRKGLCHKIITLGNKYSLSVNKRVLKNTAGYFVNRYAAEKCIQHLLPMKLPYDVALDRDWSIGIRTLCVQPFPVTFTNEETQIPKVKRVRFFRSTTFHLFHLVDYLLRICYRKKMISCNAYIDLKRGNSSA